MAMAMFALKSFSFQSTIPFIFFTLQFPFFCHFQFKINIAYTRFFGKNSKLCIKFSNIKQEYKIDKNHITEQIYASVRANFATIENVRYESGKDSFEKLNF